MPNDNYKVQHGCWDCEHQQWGRDGQWCPYVPVAVWRKTGICDRHEKEKVNESQNYS